MEEKRNTFGGSIGFVLAAAGSAVGLGNIWRFPYLAAKDGGGIFLIIYLALALTFGYALLTTEIAIGRNTKQSPLTAYNKLKTGWKFLGVLSCLVPVIILPYYCVIGGWVLKYFLAFLTGQGPAAAEDGHFSTFITSEAEPIIMLLLFLFAVALIIYMGVNKGIESSSKIIMPLLLLCVIGISVFTLTISYTDADNITRTGLEGLKIYLIPNVKGMTVSGLFTVFIDALGQLFFSLSIAMGIMITYGSYVKNNANLGQSINQIEIFDTLVAFLAGMMIIPSVYTFMGQEGMTSGPSLMFVSLPKVFRAMGSIGNVIGCAFFVMVLFAALTSAMSVMEAVVSSLMDQFGMSRSKAVVTEGLVALIGGVIVCLGYNKLYFAYTLPNGTVAQILDIMDYISNNLLMPLVALCTCILIGWVLKPDMVIKEVERNGETMGRKRLFVIMLKYIAPLFLLLLLMQTTGVLQLVVQ